MIHIFLLYSLFFCDIVLLEHILLSKLFDDIELYEKGIKIHKAYVQQFHRCFFIESTIIDDFFYQVSIVRGIFFLIIEQQTKVLKKESFEAIFFLTRKKKLKLLEIALNFDAFLSLNFVSRTHEGIANCEIE